MINELVNYKAKSFTVEANKSSIAYEVKRTRAVWDDGLAIPGTNRRGGWRCPPGTRYGGQITDRFGRNCGWGVSRRLANEISDLGERLENIGDRRRGRRAAAAAERAAKPGRIERAAGRIARALDTDSRTIDAPEAPKPARVRRGEAAPRRPRGGNLRFSEERRMEREINNPNAPRTGEPERPARPRRPRPEPAQARRREATAAAARNKPAPAPQNEFGNAQDVNRIINDRDFADYDDDKLARLRDFAQGFNDEGNIIGENHLNVLDAEIARRRQPAKKAAKKKAPAKKAPAKKKAVKKKAPAKKAPARRVTPAAGGDAEPPRMATQPPAPAAARPRNTVVRPIRDFTGFDVFNDDMSQAPARIDALDPAVDEVNWADSVRQINQFIQRLGREDDDMILEFPDEEQISVRDFKNNLHASLRAWERYGERRRALNQPREATPAPAQSAPPIDGLRQVFAGRDLGWRRDFPAERERIRGLENFDGMNENAVMREIEEIRKNRDWNAEYLRNLEALDGEQKIQMPNGVVKAKDLKRDVKAVVDAWDERRALADQRMLSINRQRLPGLGRNLRGQEVNGFADIAAARNNLDEMVINYPGTRMNIVEYNNRFYVVDQQQLDSARANGHLNNAVVREHRGGLPLAAELPPVDTEVARQAKQRVDDAIQKRQDILADYLNGRYGEGNAPWKEMTPERLQELSRAAASGDAAAKRKLTKWAEDMYSHAEIQGMNGKTYRTVASATYNGYEISVGVRIQRKSANGQWVNVGSSTRTIAHNSNPPWVYNNRMFIDDPADKNAGIQTIYNQHAFMYAKAAGFKYFKVSAADDGRFVWGKVGFKQSIDASNVALINDEVAKFRAGRPSLIRSETDARIVEHLVGQYVRDRNSVRHMDFVMAISNAERGPAKKTRDTEIKKWFTKYMVFSSGTFYLDENNIVADPRDRPRR